MESALMIITTLAGIGKLYYAMKASRDKGTVMRRTIKIIERETTIEETKRRE